MNCCTESSLASLANFGGLKEATEKRRGMTSVASMQSENGNRIGDLGNIWPHYALLAVLSLQNARQEV